MFVYDKKLAAYAERHCAYGKQLFLCLRYYRDGRIDRATNARLQKHILDSMARVRRDAQEYARRHGLSEADLNQYWW